LGSRAAVGDREEAAMGKVDIERAVHLMTWPAPDGLPHEWPSPIPLPVEPDEPVAVPVGEEEPRDLPEPCEELDQVADEEEGAQARAIAEFLAANLEHPRRLAYVLELIGIAFDVAPGCAERLFWRAHEHGYVSLREGVVHVDRTPAHR
jgi:hypothetical protein